LEEMAEEEALQLQDEDSMSSALQDLAAFIFITNEAKGIITPQNALYLAEVAEQVVNILFLERQRLADELEQLRHRNMELEFILTSRTGFVGNA